MNQFLIVRDEAGNPVCTQCERLWHEHRIDEQRGCTEAFYAEVA